MQNHNINNKAELRNYLAEHILPVKYAYTMSASDYHTLYAKSQGYKSNVKIDDQKYIFLSNYLEDGCYDYCEIGGDDGEISLDIINSLKRKNMSFNQHIFLDFSNELLSKCKENVKSALPNSKSTFIQCDIEQKNIIIPYESKKKVIFFLGNTLGNVESEENVLKNIYNFMNEFDFLLLGLTFHHNNYYELEGYDNDLFRKSILEFLRIIGIKIKEENYILKYNDMLHTIFCEYVLDENFLFQDLLLHKGEKIRCFQSRRYNMDYCIDLFKNNCFDLLNVISDTDSRHVLFLLKKANNRGK